MDWDTNYKKNKWTICLEHCYFLGGEKVIRNHIIAIPPTSGDRIDVLGASGHYYYGMTKKEWNANMTPEDYLDQNLKTNDKKERKKALKKIDWTPRIIDDAIELVIDIKAGVPTIKGKL